MYCKYCGNQIDDDSAFCSKCGKPLGGKTKSTAPKVESGSGEGSSFLKMLYGVIALVCMVPVPIAEYRRIVLGAPMVQYWLTCAPMVISAILIYKLLSADKLKEEKARVLQAKAQGRNYEDQSSKIKTNAMTLCCVIVAIVAFASGGIIHLLF